jgi:hypothetical protein
VQRTILVTDIEYDGLRSTGINLGSFNNSCHTKVLRLCDYLPGDICLASSRPAVEA